MKIGKLTYEIKIAKSKHQKIYDFIATVASCTVGAIIGNALFDIFFK
jgi:hypothetical protein